MKLSFKQNTKVDTEKSDHISNILDDANLGNITDEPGSYLKIIDAPAAGVIGLTHGFGDWGNNRAIRTLRVYQNGKKNCQKFQKGTSIFFKTKREKSLLTKLTRMLLQTTYQDKAVQTDFEEEITNAVLMKELLEQIKMLNSRVSLMETTYVEKDHGKKPDLIVHSYMLLLWTYFDSIYNYRR
ncbi:hypothetical protein R3W88_027248 [Solanum pinnatisectum]|uniref:Uncharacterized protein n=1 Tax=Solanum pinnatisectum TaxID=50273 RepID=A0AAV9LGN4_9SOLN|nr:hypothetical protein R3W88_027248 [Solanum pinnatisectum]